MKTVIDGLRAAGYLVGLSGDSINYRWAGIGQPDPDFIAPLLKQLKEGKSEAIEVLRTDIEEDLQEAFEERAAILEYDAGLDREEAERQAKAMVFGSHEQV